MPLDLTDASVRDEVATWDALTVTIRASRQDTLNTYRPLESDAGSIDVLATDDGGFRAVDRSGGGATVDVTFPDAREPLRKSGTYLVSEYEDEQVGPEAEEFDVSLTLVPERPRDLAGLLLDQSGAWRFVTEEGTIGTDRVEAGIVSRGEDGMDRWDLVVTMTDTQAGAFERSAARLNGVRIREIPDGTDLAVDDTLGRGSVVVDAPETEEIRPLQYAIEEWESEQLNNDFQRVDMELAPQIVQQLAGRVESVAVIRADEAVTVGEVARPSAVAVPRALRESVVANDSATVDAFARPVAGDFVEISTGATMGGPNGAVMGGTYGATMGGSVTVRQGRELVTVGEDARPDATATPTGKDTSTGEVASGATMGGPDGATMGGPDGATMGPTSWSLD